MVGGLLYTIAIDTLANNKKKMERVIGVFLHRNLYLSAYNRCRN